MLPRYWGLMALLLFALSAPTLFGQGETTGNITGVVQDSTGASVPGARVTLTNTDTGETRTQQTGTAGDYSFVSLGLGNYRLAVEASGFRRYVQENIVVHVNDHLRIDPSMEIGQATETVTVTEQTTPVETEQPALSGLVNGTQVRELPLPNRNFMGLTLLVPGVTYTGGREISLGGLSGNPFFINGARQTANNWMVDGSRNTDTGSNGTLFNYPSVDAISEFRILTNSYDAQFGRNAGGIINVVTRGGTKDYHGGAYEFVRNDVFAARDPLQFTRPIPDRNSLKTPLRYNNYGYNLGGPFYIPKLYPRSKSKTFFFFSEEWRKIRQSSVLATDVVPTIAQRQGIFTTTIKDPTTGLPFQNNTIPANRIDPNSKAFLDGNYWPLPNISATQFRFVGGTPVDFRQELVRVDHNVTDDFRLMVRYVHDQFSQLNAAGIWSGSPLPDIFPNSTQTPATNIVAKGTYILNPRMLNEFQFDYATNAISSNLASGARGLRSNFPGFKTGEIYPNGPAHNVLNLIPNLSISGIDTASSSFAPFFNENPSFTYQDNFAWTIGRHDLKFGALYSREHKNESSGGGNTPGTYTFNGNVTGNAFADFLLGRTANGGYSEDQTDVTVHVYYPAFEWYAQDTWKVSTNFTLTVGVRYSWFSNPIDEQNLLVAFVPGLYNPATAPKVLANGTLATDASGNVIGDRFDGLIFPKGVLSGHDSPWGHRVQSNSLADFGPRIGMAWDPTGKGNWSVRAGYGVYYDRTLVGIVEQNGFSDPLANAGVSIDNALISDPRAGAANNAKFPLAITSTGSPFITPRTQQWNLSVQHQLGAGTLVEVAYAGSGSNHLLRQLQLNEPLPQAARAFNNSINLVRPFQGFAGINDRETRATSRYHALQTLLRHTMSSKLGITANFSYTYSKVMTDSSDDRGDTPQNTYNLRAERGPANYDRTHVITPSIVWDIPFSKSHGALAYNVLGGWEVASIMSFWTGRPRNVAQLGDPLLVGGNSRPNVIGTPTIHNDPSTRLCYIFSSTNPNCAGLSGADAFQQLTATSPTFGNTGRYVIRAPGVENVDLAVYKNFVFGGRENAPRLQFRAESFNFLNNIQLNDPASTTLGSASFGQITSDRGPRIIQFGLKLSF